MNQKTTYNNQSINHIYILSSGRLVCGCHIVLRLFCLVFFLTLLVKQRPFTFVQSFFDVRAPRQPKSVSSFSPFVYFGDVAFFRVFFVPLPFSLCMESTLYVFSFQMVFFLVQPCFLWGPTRGKMAMVQKILGEKRYLQNKQKGKRKKHFLAVGASAHRRTIERR